MIRRTSIFASSLLLAAFISICASCGGGGGDSDSEDGSANSNITAVWANDGGDKVTKDEGRASTDSSAVANSVWDGEKVQIFGAKNEVVAFNLILEVASDGTAASNVSVSFDTLTSSDDTTISSSSVSGDDVFDWTSRNIELFFVRYLQIKGLSSNLFYDTYDERHIPERLRRSWSGDGEGSGTWSDRTDHDKYYPDIAVPLELVNEFGISAGENQSIWVDIFIPKTVTAGTYSGTVSILEGGSTTHEIPVELTVKDFTLPDTPSSKTMLAIGYEDINDRYLGTEYPSTESDLTSSQLIRDRHFLMAHRHKISVVDSNGDTDWEQDRPRPEWEARLDGSLFTSDNGYDGPGISVGNDIFAIGLYGSWGWQGDGQSAMNQHTNSWVDWFDQNSPNTTYFLYLTDEPDSSGYAEVEQWAGWINSNGGSGSRLKSFATVSLPTALQNMPSLDIVASWTGLGVTSQWDSAYTQISNASGKNFYMYNSLRPTTGSYATEDDGIALRQLPWGQYKKGIERWFYWESTYYNNYQGNTGQTNVFQTAMTFGDFDSTDESTGETGFNYNNGDGVLFYPGTDLRYTDDSYGVSGPIASLRLKHWRRGIQDVDYLTMAAEINPSRVQTIVEQIAPTVLWECGVDDPSDPTYVLMDISWSNDPDIWEAARAELASIIEGGS